MTPTAFVILVILLPVAAFVITCVRIYTRVASSPRVPFLWLIPTAAIVAGGPAVALVVADQVEWGDYVCVRCGQSSGRVSFFGAGVAAPMEMERGVGPSSDAYARAFLGQGVHQHAWLRVGRHTWRTVYCTEIGTCSWFRDLPRIQDQSVARACASKLLATSEREQADVLRSYDFAGYDSNTPGERFSAWRAAWRRDHTDWP